MVKYIHTLSRNALEHTFLPSGDYPPVEWRIDRGLISYPIAIDFMEKRVKQIYSGYADELIWLVEHPPLYTIGTSAKEKDLLDPDCLPIYHTGRGGGFTYHGPGQRIAYVMLDLKRRKQDVRAFVSALEEWGIRMLANFNVRGERREDRVGIWISRSEKFKRINNVSVEDKIVAIGVRLWKWISFHGIAINVAPHLEHYSGIVPCGISDTKYGVTSLIDLGLPITMEDVDSALGITFRQIFGALR